MSGAPPIDLLPERLPEIEAHLRALGWIGSDAVLVSAGSAGEGNMNRTLRVRVDSGVREEPTSLILKQAVPFVARFPEIEAPVERGEVEAAFYKAVSADPQLAGQMPRLLGQDPSARLLCFEDLGESRDMSSLYRSAASPVAGAGIEDALDAVVDWLSRLHALPLPSEFPANRGMRVLNHAHLFVVPFDSDSGVDLSEPLARFRDALGADRAFMERVVELGRVYLGEASFDSKPVLLHGDYYPGSWVRDPQGGVRILDPEFGFVGPAEIDVGVMEAHLVFAGSNDAARRRRMERYRPPAGFDRDQARRFAGIEVLRRLLGVAQLPVPEDADLRLAWAREAAEWV